MTVYNEDLTYRIIQDVHFMHMNTKFKNGTTAKRGMMIM